MKDLLSLFGNGCALAGVLACLVAGLARISGSFSLAGVEAGTIFLMGVGLMVLACLIMLQRLLTLLADR